MVGKKRKRGTALFSFEIREVTLCSRLRSVKSRSVLVCDPWSHALFSFWSVKSRSVLVCDPWSHVLFSLVIREVTLCSRLWSVKSRSVLVWGPWSHALFSSEVREVTLCSRLRSVKSRSVLVCGPWSHALFSSAVREVTLCSRLWSVKSCSVLVCGPSSVTHSSPSSVSDQLSFRLIFDSLEGTGGCFSVVHGGLLLSPRDASYGAGALTMNRDYGRPGLNQSSWL